MPQSDISSFPQGNKDLCMDGKTSKQCPTTILGQNADSGNYFPELDRSFWILQLNRPLVDVAIFLS